MKKKSKIKGIVLGTAQALVKKHLMGIQKNEMK